MKNIFFTTIAILFSYHVHSQVFWTEAFENSCAANCVAAGSNTGNGPWTVSDSSPAVDGCGFPTAPNQWYVSCAENGNAAGVCGMTCANDESLHIGSTTVGDLGAAYDAGGWCDFGLGGWGEGTPTDKRCESPTINCTAYSSITLAFNYIENGQTTLDDATLWWFDGATWSQLANMAKTTLCGGQGMWTAFSIAMPAAANNNPNVKIAFRWVNNDDGTGTDPSFAVDDITLSVVSAGNTITTGTITGSPFCACTTVSVPFTSTGTFTAGNIYTAQLSNSTGSFAAPVSIGTLTSTANSGTITATIPCNTVSGTQYRIRVISSTPSVTGSDNGVNITINAAPSAPVIGTITQPTCSVSTGSVALSGLPASGSWTVTAAPGGATITGTGTTGTFSGLTASTSYTFTVTNSSGCTSTASANASINAVPSAPTAPVIGTITQPNCASPTGSVDLSGLPASGSWTVTASPGATTITGSGTTSTFSGLTAGTTYTFTVTNSSGCTSSASSNAMINTVPGAPTAPVIGTITQPSCSVSTANVDLSGLPSSGTWTVTATPGGTTITGTGTTGTFTGLTAGTTYTFTVTNGSGCTSSSSTNVVINSQPSNPSVPVIGTITQPTCTISTGSVDLSSLPSSGTWTVTASPGATTITGTGTTGTFSGLTAGTTYTFTVTNSDGCTSGASGNAVINSVPTAPASPTASVTVQPTCATPTGTIVVTAPTGATIEYSVGGSYQASGTFSGLTPNTYNVTVQDNSTSCTSAPTVLVVDPVAGAPVITVDSQTDVTCFGDNDGDATVSVTGGVSPYTFSWSPTGGNGATASNLTAGIYTVTVTDDSGCSSAENVTIGSPTQIVINGNETDVICGSAAGSISTSVTGGSAVYTYDWNTGATSSSINGLIPGNYSVIVTDDSGCSATEAYSISSAGSLTASVTPISSTINSGETVQLTATGGTDYSWSPATDLSCTDCPNPIASPMITTIYTVTVSDSAGCTGTDNATIVVNIICGELFVPTIFSPNGDLNNDKLEVFGLENCVNEYSFEIYDRWGEKVFETTDASVFWDGTYKGKLMNTGIYFYKLNAMIYDGTVILLSGNTTLVR